MFLKSLISSFWFRWVLILIIILIFAGWATNNLLFSLIATSLIGVLILFKKDLLNNSQYVTNYILQFLILLILALAIFGVYTVLTWFKIA